MNTNNIFRNLRLQGICDDGSATDLQKENIVNKTKECIVISTAKYKGFYTFGIYLKSQFTVVPIEIRPSAESGIFKERTHAKLYALGCLVLLFPKMSDEAANMVRIKIAELRYTKLVFGDV